MDGMKHLLIGGTSFCGSTVMSMVLGTANGAANVGETNWIVPFENAYRCRLCGEACAFWTTEFLESLDRDETRWFPRIAERLETDVLISSEKSMNHVKRFDSELQNCSVVLFKSPASFWQSIRKRRWRKEDLERSMTIWRRVYEGYLDDAYQPAGGMAYVDVEKFMAAPTRAIPMLYEALGLTGSTEQALRYWEKKHHYIGGNFDVYQRLNEVGEAGMALRPFPVGESAREEVEKFDALGVAELYDRLQGRDILNGMALADDDRASPGSQEVTGEAK